MGVSGAPVQPRPVQDAILRRATEELQDKGFIVALLGRAPDREGVVSGGQAGMRWSNS